MHRAALDSGRNDFILDGMAPLGLTGKWKCRILKKTHRRRISPAGDRGKGVDLHTIKKTSGRCPDLFIFTSDVLLLVVFAIIHREIVYAHCTQT